MAWLSSFYKVSSLILFFHLSTFAAPVVDPQPVIFKKDRIKFAGKVIEVERAENEAQRSRGLMFREKLRENEGMLFIFDHEQYLSFWMKNTFLDLSIGYFDKNKTLVDVQEMKAVKSVLIDNLPSYPSAKPAQYALEMKKGWFGKNKVNLGSKFEFIGQSRSKSKPH